MDSSNATNERFRVVPHLLTKLVGQPGTDLTNPITARFQRVAKAAGAGPL
jgi:hypothetical protein